VTTSQHAGKATGPKLSGLVRFNFIVTFQTVYQTLSHPAGITVKLQSATLDIAKADQMVQDIKAVYRSMRANSFVTRYALLYARYRATCFESSWF